MRCRRWRQVILAAAGGADRARLRSACPAAPIPIDRPILPSQVRAFSELYAAELLRVSRRRWTSGRGAPPQRSAVPGPGRRRRRLRRIIARRQSRGTAMPGFSAEGRRVSHRRAGRRAHPRDALAMGPARAVQGRCPAARIAGRVAIPREAARRTGCSARAATGRMVAAPPRAARSSIGRTLRLVSDQALRSRRDRGPAGPRDAGLPEGRCPVDRCRPRRCQTWWRGWPRHRVP